MLLLISFMLLLSHFSRVRLCATPQMAAHQALPSPYPPGKNIGVGCHFLLQLLASYPVYLFQSCGMNLILMYMIQFTYISLNLQVRIVYCKFSTALGLDHCSIHEYCKYISNSNQKKTNSKQKTILKSHTTLGSKITSRDTCIQ